MTHQRRLKSKIGATVKFTEKMHLTMTKSEFLLNKTNKQRFVEMLGEELEKNNCKSYYASADADLLIVQKAVESATTKETVVIGDDTDLLVLLCYHACLDTCSLLFKPEPKKNAKNIRVWDIQAVKQQLGADVCNHILFIHSILGCDTTSRLHGLGKGIALRKFREQHRFVELAGVFDSISQKEDIITAGEEALILLYNGKDEKSLDSLRYKRYCDKVARSSSFVHPQNLPPTSSAAKYHSLRVYYQIRQWQGTEDGMSPQDWGWKENDGVLIPVTTDLEPAPNELLQIIRCNCQTDCSTLRCSCRKHGLNCSIACGNCRGSGCCNSNPEMDLDDETETIEQLSE